MFRLFFVLVFSFLTTDLLALTEIKNVRSWSAPDRTRLVFDLSNHAHYEVIPLIDLNQLTLRLKTTQLLTDLPAFPSHPVIEHMAHENREGELLISIGLRQKVKIKDFQLTPNGQYGNRLVIDLSLEDEKESPQKQKLASITTNNIVTVGRDIIIAIDAGHGGEDPGAIGPSGVREKDVVLQMAKRLKRLIDAEAGMKGKLVRTGDYFIPLRKRMQIARKFGADFFISIHADAFKNPAAHGSSVFVLSKKGATSEAARWLAKKENESDLVGGVSLDDKENVLASVLLDLSQAATMQASHEVAAKTLLNLSKVNDMHSHRVQGARFVVLKSPDIPSILVETAFISNPREERKLTNPREQKKIVKAVFKGVQDYFLQAPPVGTKLALEKYNSRLELERYVIVPGDTLSAIAARYGISLRKLKKINNLDSNLIRVGQELRVP